MTKPLGLARLLLLSTALVAPGVAAAQTVSADAAAEGQTVPDAGQTNDQNDAGAATTTGGPQQGGSDVSIPGGDIVVTGRRYGVERATSEVVSVLSSDDIARTGEGDIAGALSRVTGLSVVGNGFVYVRGLGDRYSLALLNGSPLPSPQPLKRVVPLDIFPTNVVSSALVQKSYSVNYPGEFGGGVINLTTQAVPDESFVNISGTVGGDTYTTGNLGYVYYGSASDWTGFDNGARDYPPALKNYFDSGNRISDLSQDEQETLAGQLIRGNNAVLQRNDNMPVNWEGALSGGTSFDLGGSTLGVIASAGIKNHFLTRQTTQQSPSSADLSQKELNFQRVITDDRIQVHGLFGLGLDFGERNRIRWTNLFIRDTLKEARLGLGTRQTTAPGATFEQTDTAWFERQLFDTQLVGEFHTDTLSVDWRFAYANTQRESPNETSFEYYRSNRDNDPFGDIFVNRLNNGQQGSASIAYSDLHEDLYSGGLDVGYDLLQDVRATVGYAFSDTERFSSRREFLFVAPNNGQNFDAAVLRPDYLLGTAPVQYYNIRLIETTQSNPAFNARLRSDAGYLKFDVGVVPQVDMNFGVRYEAATQTVRAARVFTDQSLGQPTTALNNDYWLPAGTITWKFLPDFQLRLNASKTIARPQFRELIFQQYYDPQQNRQFRGNPLLNDSQLFNAEGRLEWYPTAASHLSVGGFYKHIDNPIENFTGFTDNQPETSFANAPAAKLYGAEVEAEGSFPLFAQRNLVVSGNYTYTQSSLDVTEDDIVAVFGTSPQPALNFFRDGVPLTGQSDHLANLQVGLEDQDHLSQQTILLSYASKRVTSRGPAGQPDIYEYPGISLDFVARQGVTLGGVDMQLSFEARNLTGTDYKEYQESGDNRIYYNRYDVGTRFQIGLSVGI